MLVYIAEIFDITDISVLNICIMYRVHRLKPRCGVSPSSHLTVAALT